MNAPAYWIAESRIVLRENNELAQCIVWAVGIGDHTLAWFLAHADARTFLAALEAQAGLWGAL
jgi:hypothetical protein